MAISQCRPHSLLTADVTVINEIMRTFNNENTNPTYNYNKDNGKYTEWHLLQQCAERQTHMIQTNSSTVNTHDTLYRQTVDTLRQTWSHDKYRQYLTGWLKGTRTSCTGSRLAVQASASPWHTTLRWSPSCLPELKRRCLIQLHPTRATPSRGCLTHAVRRTITCWSRLLIATWGEGGGVTYKAWGVTLITRVGRVGGS